MATQIQSFVAEVVNNTDPSSRAGCALALGEIYSHVGGMSAGAALKTIVDVLMSLSADPHPLVHFWALQALGRVVNAAGLSYSPFVNATLGMISKLYMQDSHEPEGGSAGSANLRGDLPAYQAFCQILDGLIGVLGPELQVSAPVRSLVLLLVREFRSEPDEGVQVEAMKATQHFLMFAPDFIDLPGLVETLRDGLSSSRRPFKVASINSVYQLVQRNAALMSKLGGDRLVAELFALLDDDPGIEGVRDAIMSWLKQTAASNPSGWIDLCQRIMSRVNAAKQASEVSAVAVPSGVENIFTDEESQGLGVDSGEGAGGPMAQGRATSRWRTQLFALRCIHEVFVTVIQSGRQEHFDATAARKNRVNARRLLITRVSDLIKMAFTASAAQVMEIRLEGLVVLRDVIEVSQSSLSTMQARSSSDGGVFFLTGKNFSKTRDIDFDEALLLEQHQAPIAAALTPAFASDSYPEVLASGIQTCAIFVSSGVVKEIDRMGRILKLLTSALESCKG
jgi:hypothetical protein